MQRQSTEMLREILMDSEFNMQRYDEEDSNHSVNGWIKKEVEDDDEMDEYLKQGQMNESDPGDHYEDLMGLSKEDLVGRILQQEEDIRFLQDIRNGLEKSVQELSATSTQFQNMLNHMSSIMASVKDRQTAGTAASDHTSSSSASAVSSSKPVVSAAETSPRSTPGSNSISCPPASPKTVPAAQNIARSTQSSTPSYSSSSSSVVPAKERTHSFTITRSTNVTIKTEIPSPPPEPEVIENPMQTSPGLSIGQITNFPKKRRCDGPNFQSQQNMNSVPTSAGFSTNQMGPRAFGPRAKGNVGMSMPQQQNQQRPRMQAATRAQYAAQRGESQGFQMRQPPVQNVRMPSPRFQRGNVRMPRGRNVYNTSFTTQPCQPTAQSANASNVSQRSQNVSHVKITPVPSTTASSPVTNVLADFAAKMPSGITLSIVPSSGSSTPKSQSKVVDSSSGPMMIKTSESADKPSSTSSSSTFSSNVVSKSAVGKNVTSSAPASSTTSSSGQPRTVINFGDDDDDENDDYDEIAVLIPDKKTPIIEEDSDNPKDSQTSHKKNPRVAEMFSPQSMDSPSNWPSQSGALAVSGPKGSGKMYHNNDEYLFDEPLDDTDTDENDPKFYLGEDVSLPKDVVHNCIKEGPTPDQLTRNLMAALFPDLQQIAAGCDSTDSNKAYTALPTNKVNAVIALVQKRFPLCNRKVILSVINAKFKETKASLGRTSHNRTRAYKQY